MSEIIWKLNLESPNIRPTNTRLTIVHKTINGHLALPIGNSLPVLRRTRHLNRKAYNTISHLSQLSWPSPCTGPASILVIQYFRSCVMSSVSWYFFMSPCRCMLSLHLFLGRPLFLLPETSSRSDFAQMWLGSRLKQWPNHFSLLFSRKVSTGFTWASFLMSSFLMWSNLVFPLAHLNILISAEFSLLSSFFFTAQHSDRTSSLVWWLFWRLCLSILRASSYRITPDTSFHFIHPILIMLLASACEPPSLVNSDPRYVKDVTVVSSASTSFTVVSVSFVGLGKYSVFVLLIFSPWLSNTTLKASRSSSTSSRVIAHSTRSSANIIAQGGSFLMFYVRTSIIIIIIIIIIIMAEMAAV